MRGSFVCALMMKGSSFRASYLSPSWLCIPVGVRDPPSELQHVRVRIRALVVRTFGHQQLTLLSAEGPVAPGFDGMLQTGSALTKWLSLVKVILVVPQMERASSKLRWRSGLQCEDDDVG